MIYYDSVFQAPRTPEVFTMADNHNSYVYVSRNLYDTALLLSSRYNDNITQIEAAVAGGKRKFLENKELVELMLEMYTSCPAPMNALFPFLALTHEYEVPKFEDDNDRRLYAYSTLDLVLSSIDALGYLRLPENARAELKVPKHLLANYKNRLMQVCSLWFTGEVLMPISQKVTNYVAPVQQVVTQTVTPAQAVPAQTQTEPKKLNTNVTNSVADKVMPGAKQDNTVTDEEYEAIMKKFEEEDKKMAELRKKQKALKDSKKKEEPKAERPKVETSQQKENREVSSLLESLLEDD